MESTENTDKASEKIKKEDIGAIVIISIFLFFENPIWWIAYGLGLGLVVFLMIKVKTLATFVFCFFVTYSMASFCISISPYLKIKDFRLFHPRYVQVQNFFITDAIYKYYDNEATGYHYAIIDYTFTLNGQSHQQTDDDIVKWSTDESNRKLDQILEEDDFFVFANPKDLRKSKMFCSDRYFYLDGSEGYHLLRGMFWSIMATGLLFLTVAVFLKLRGKI